MSPSVGYPTEYREKYPDRVAHWSVYALKDPDTLAVRYVGWTNKTPRRRLQGHMSDARKKRDSHVRRWLVSLENAGKTPVIEVLETGTGDSWHDAEIKWIKHFRDTGCRLTNIAGGGGGVTGRVKGPAERASISWHKKQYWANLTADERALVGARMSNGCDREARSVSAAKKMTDPALRNRLAMSQLNVSTDVISARRKKMWAARTPEQRSQMARDREAKKTPEQRRNQSLRAWATRRSGAAI